MWSWYIVNIIQINLQSEVITYSNQAGGTIMTICFPLVSPFSHTVAARHQLLNEHMHVSGMIQFFANGLTLFHYSDQKVVVIRHKILPRMAVKKITASEQTWMKMMQA